MLRYSTDIFGYMIENRFVPKNLTEKNKIYCIDIDGTLCTEDCEYKDAQPIQKVINKINVESSLIDQDKNILIWGPLVGVAGKC